MFEVVRSFFLDGATFKRTVSDVVFFGSALAGTPAGQSLIAGAVSPHATYVPALLSLVAAAYSMRTRQTQTPPGA